MKRSFVEAVLTVMIIIMMSTAGHAAFAVPHNFQCDNCHGKFSGDSLIKPNNSCLTCHSALGEASRKPVETDAMSNYFGSDSNQPVTGSRSTHTWGAYSAAGHPYNPRAMVHEPTNTALNTGYNSFNLRGKSTCFRCHNSKATTNATMGVDKPFLRATNVNDALCLDCHRVRNTNTQATGSHPVAYRAYSTVYKSNTSAYRKTPLSGNIYNPTANPGNYLSGGKIVCSTCHAPHYADSSSATLGNRSTANGFAQDDIAKGLKGQLQNSKGQLLRNDPIGASAAAINACSSCHKETANLNHNAKGQNVQCGHCHGAHVDYTGDGSAPNLKLVRRDFSNISTNGIKLGANVKVIYNTATSLRFKRADGNGICQICHTPTPGVAIHDLDDTRADDCISCHKHSNGFSAADCTSCHGQPPITSLVGGPNGKASASYSLDESLSPHATHADPAYYHYACKNCHYEGTRQDSHNTSTPSFQSVFVDPTNSSIGVLAGQVKNVPGDYNPSAKTCSNVYCHSNGNPRGGAYTTFATPSWEYGRNKILGTVAECTSCHQSGPTLITNAHSKHVTTNSMKCSVCHAATVSSSSAISDRAKHANGVKDVKFITRPATYYGVFSSSWNSTTATCNNSCHSNGLGGAPAEQPVWTNSATGDCGSCHAAVATTSLHPFHFTGSTGPLLGASPDCASCHDYATGAITHANGDVDLKPGNSCAPCHPGTSPIWATGATVTCESCHTGATASEVTNQSGTYTAPLKALNSTVGHGQYAMAAQCTNCHSASAPHIGAGPTEKRLAPLSGNALCNNCHKSSVMGNMSTTRANLLTHSGFNHYTTTADGRASECAGCHDTHGTTNRMSIRTVINGQTVAYTGSTPVFVVTSAPYNGLCQVCHTKTKYYNNGVPYVAHNLASNCLSCHKHKGEGVTYAFEPVGGDCGSCHGYPPVKVMAGLGTLGNYSHAKLEDYSGGGGAHTVAGHISRTALQGEEWTNCNNCHNSSSHATGGTPAKQQFVNVVVDPKFKFNNATSIVYSSNSCSNVSCHFKPSPNWVTGQ